MADSSLSVESQGQDILGKQTDMELGVSQDADLEMAELENPHPMGLDSSGDGEITGPNLDTDAPAADTKPPSKKDTSLREFLDKMDDYAPIVGRA